MIEMHVEDILSIRRKLLIIMMKACLDDCPMGTRRKEAISNNARALEKAHFRDQSTTGTVRLGGDFGLGEESGTVLFERFDLLIIMAKTFAGGYPIGRFRKLAITRNLSEVTRLMGVGMEVGEISCLGGV